VIERDVVSELVEGEPDAIRPYSAIAGRPEWAAMRHMASRSKGAHRTLPPVGIEAIKDRGGALHRRGVAFVV
jgi:hypothetical protein